MSNFTPAEKITAARIDFIHKESVFYGTLALRLTPIACTWVPTAATDGYHLYYNPEFIAKLDSSEVKFVVGHEVGHNVYEHFLRRNGREPRLWNCAGDYVINLELQDMQIGTMPPNEKFFNEEWVKENPEKAKEIGDKPGGLIDEKYRGMSSEEVYTLLEEDQKNGKMPKYNSFDMHIDPNSPGMPGDDSGDQKGDPTGKNGPVPLSKEQLDRLPDEIRRAVMDAAKIAESTPGAAGNIPGGVKSLIEQWTDSQMDWRELLVAKIQSTIKSDYTWTRQSRKSMYGGFYLPGMLNDEEISVHCAIDTSGSMSEQMLRDLLGEVKGIMEQFAQFKLCVWCFDTQTYTFYEYTQDTIDELDEFVVEGRGGTMFECNWEMLKEKELIPDQLVVFTDGYPCGTWGDPDYCETLFIIHGDKSIRTPFGTSVYYDKVKEAKRAAAA